MLSEPVATAKVKKAFPGADISSPVSYKGDYVFRVITDDPDEGEYDPFYAVNQDTGALAGFPLMLGSNLQDISALFLAKEEPK